MKSKEKEAINNEQFLKKLKGIQEQIEDEFVSTSLKKGAQSYLDDQKIFAQNEK